MKKRSPKSSSPIDLETLWKNAEWSGRVLSEFVGSGLGAALRSVGLVTAADLAQIDRTLERLDRRLRKLEARRRGARSEPATAAPATVESAERVIGQ